MEITDLAEEGRSSEAQRADRLGRLYSDHAPGGLRLALLLTGDRELAEDLIQDAFVRIVGRFRHLRIRYSFASYLNRTIVNLARDKGRRLQIERRQLERERVAASASPAESDLGTRQHVVSALMTLPARQRAAMVLRYYQDLSEQQVADVLDLSLPATKSLISRGMESLRKIIGGPNDE